MIVSKINVSRIDKAHLYQGKNGKYLDIALHENKNGPDQSGNDGFVTQSVSKEARDRGEKGPIIGNWRRVKKRSEPKPKDNPTSGEPPEDDVPF